MSKKARIKFPIKVHQPMEEIFTKVKPRNLLMPVPFTKKHKVVHKVKDPNAEEKLVLVENAAKLRSEIFRDRRCALCPQIDWGLPTAPHHILSKGSYDRLRFEIWNLLPLCVLHHDYAHAEQYLFKWNLQDVYPRHYRYYLNEKDNRTPVQQTVESLTKIVEDLQYYADHPLEAEQVIYEKD